MEKSTTYEAPHYAVFFNLPEMPAGFTFYIVQIIPIYFAWNM
jgi:hypothetical protein